MAVLAVPFVRTVISQAIVQATVMVMVSLQGQHSAWFVQQENTRSRTKASTAMIAVLDFSLLRGEQTALLAVLEHTLPQLEQSSVSNVIVGKKPID